MRRKNVVVKMFNEQCRLCCYCGNKMTLTLGKRRTATREHIKPKSQGGGIRDNFAAACLECNKEKGNTPLIIYLLKKAQQRDAISYRQ